MKIQKIFKMLVGKDSRRTIQKWCSGWRSLLQFDTVRKIVEGEDFGYALFEPFPDGDSSALCGGFFNFDWVDRIGGHHKTTIEGNGTISKDEIVK